LNLHASLLDNGVVKGAAAGIFFFLVRRGRAAVFFENQNDVDTLTLSLCHPVVGFLEDHLALKIIRIQAFFIRNIIALAKHSFSVIESGPKKSSLSLCM
jgi:hypothetical protein